MNVGSPAAAGQHDFDLHGLVGIRLVDATLDDINRVRRQLGPLDTALEREPDITIQFVDRLAVSTPLTYVGYGDCGFSDDGFFVLRGSHRTTARARVPFESIGHRVDIICERAMPAVPHLLAIINLTALGRGVLPLHASAWTTDKEGVMVTGWAKGGKTESLLAAMEAGAVYVGDEWVYLTDDGGMYGLPEPIRLWSWHLHQLPNVLASRSRTDRARVAAWDSIARAAGAAGSLPLPGASLARRGVPLLQRQSYIQVPPVELFEPARVALQGRLDAVVLVAIHHRDEVVSRRVEPGEISARMAASLAAERASFTDHYQQFLFAFPHSRSALVDGAADIEQQLLRERLDAVPAMAVTHSYPCDIAELGSAVRAAVDEARREYRPNSNATEDSVP